MQGHSQRTSHKPSNRFLLLLGWFIIPSLFCGLPYAFADQPFQVGIIDPQAVMENSNSGQKALATLKEHIAVRQKLLEADEQELQKLEQQFQNGSDRSETETQFMQEQIQNKIQDYQRRRQIFQQELTEKQKNMMTEYMKKIAVATQTVAKRSGFLLVIDKGSDATLKIVLYSAEGLDITDEVVKEFNQRYK